MTKDSRLYRGNVWRGRMMKTWFWWHRDQGAKVWNKTCCMMRSLIMLTGSEFWGITWSLSEDLIVKIYFAGIQVSTQVPSYTLQSLKWNIISNHNETATGVLCCTYKTWAPRDCPHIVYLHAGRTAMPLKPPTPHNHKWLAMHHLTYYRYKIQFRCIWKLPGLCKWLEILRVWAVVNSNWAVKYPDWCSCADFIVGA